MDLATILGLFTGLGLIVSAVFVQSSGNDALGLVDFYDTASLLIVLGGTLAATAVAFRLAEVKRVIFLIKLVFQKPNFNFKEIVEDIVRLTEVNRSSGIKGLEDEISKTNDPFLRDGIEFITYGYSLEDIKDILVQREQFRFKKESHESDMIKTLGTYSPAFGMIGTLIGLVLMLKGMGAGDSGGMETLASSMAVALVTTFYGTFFANLIFNPFAEKIKSRNKDNSQKAKLIIEGVCLIQQKIHPIQVRDKVNYCIPPLERKTDDGSK